MNKTLLSKRIRVRVITYGALCKQDMLRAGTPADNSHLFRDKD